MRVALKFAYDGLQFYGFQRQPGKVTVEETLVNALVKVGAIESARGCGYRSSSRTDRGVSALGNLISFVTQFDVEEICPAVNSEMQDVWAYSAVQVPETFNPRAAKQRWYRYYLAKDGQDLDKMEEAASKFVGVHDFSGYARKDRRNPMRKIDSITVSDAGLFHAIDFRAESFLWNMIRRIVWMMNEASAGRMPIECAGPSPEKPPIRVGLARPEFLILMDIDCGVDFPVDSRAALGISRSVERKIRENAMRLMFAEEVRGVVVQGQRGTQA